jgi:hypothetical protein
MTPQEKGGAGVRWRWLRAVWDRALGVSLIVGGGMSLVGGYLGVSGTRRISEQAAYLASGGLGGLFLLACGATLLLTADLRDLWRQLDATEGALTSSPERAGHDLGWPVAGDASTDRREVVLARGGR